VGGPSENDFRTDILKMDLSKVLQVTQVISGGGKNKKDWNFLEAKEIIENKKSSAASPPFEKNWCEE